MLLFRSAEGEIRKVIKKGKKNKAIHQIIQNYAQFINTEEAMRA
jgi:hypothetical protein